MAAETLEELLDFEGNIEAAAVAFLTDAISDTLITRQLDLDVFTLPRIGVQFELSEALDPADNKSATDGTLAYRKFTGTLMIAIASDSTQAGSDTAHRLLRAKVRKELMISADNWTTLVDSERILPFYDISYMRPAAHLYQTDGDVYQTEMRYQIHFAIRSDAWPEPEEDNED
jgi:hypothetical protein